MITMRRVCCAVMLTLGTAGTVLAGGAVPEIDPAAATGALALLGGAILVLRGRQKR